MFRQNKKERNPFVDARTGEPTQLKGEARLAALKNGTVIAKSTFYNRQLVNAETGHRTSLTGDLLFWAIEHRTVLPRHVYKANRARLKFVNAETGESTDYVGLELAKALERGEVIPGVEFKKRMREQAKRAAQEEKALLRFSKTHEMSKRQKTSDSVIPPDALIKSGFVLTPQGLCREPLRPLLPPCVLDTGLKEMTSWIQKNMPDVTPMGLSEKAALPEKIALPEKAGLPKEVKSNLPLVSGSFVLAKGTVFYAPKSPKPTGGSSPNSPKSPTDENNASLANVLRQARL